MKNIIITIIFTALYSNTIAQTPTTIYTPTGVSVDALIRTEYSQNFLAQIEADAEDWLDDHDSDAQRVAPASATYNCHAYAFHIKDGGNTVWLNAHDDYDDDPEILKKYWSGSSPTYTQTSASEATVAFYGSCWQYGVNDCDHSAEVISPNLFESKWGAWPRYQHAPSDCPYSSSNIQYYKVPLNGEDIACVPDNESYTTLNISGASYNWSGNRINISGSSHSVTASGTSNGQGYIDVDISSPHSGTTVTTRKELWVGKADYTVLGASVDGFQAGQEELSNCELTYAEAEYNNPPYTSSISGYTGKSGITEYDWDIPYSSDWYIDEEYGSPVDWQYVEIDYYDANPPAEETIRIRAYNTCGWSYWQEVEWEVDDCASPFFSVALSPNPTQSLLTISFEENHQPSGVNEKTPMPEIPVEVALYNGQQNKILDTKGFTSNSIKVNTSNIPTGSYIIHVNIEGEQPLKKHLMIE